MPLRARPIARIGGATQSRGRRSLQQPRITAFAVSQHGVKLPYRPGPAIRASTFHSLPRRRAKAVDPAVASREGTPVQGVWPEDVQLVTLRDGRLNIVFQSGDRFSPNSFYLRDHCSCKLCRHEVTKQRLIDTFELPSDPSIKHIESSQNGVSVIWREHEHNSFYTWRWLALHARRSSQKWEAKDVEGEQQRVVTWDASIAKNLPSIDYRAVMDSDEGVRLWTKLLRKYGFCFIDGCPATPEATEKLLERIAFIRYTHYGGFWDFTSDLRSKDTAYTSIALEAHTDTTYFRDPAGLQMFHLLSHTEGDGGQSLLVDGWRAAAVLRQESPEAYDILKTQPMRWHSSGNADVQIDASGPVLTDHVPHDGAILWPTTIPGPIRWNNSDRANSVGVEHGAYALWLEAARRWNSIVKDPSLEYWEQLQPGRPLIFDNQRVLHGRSSFTGKRRLCGGYINMDDFISRWRTLNFKRDLLLDHQA